MANYTVLHTCGHTKDHNITGKVRLRANRAAHLETTTCHECRQAEQARKRDEANAHAAEAVIDANLPGMMGSDKQVAWANTMMG